MSVLRRNFRKRFWREITDFKGQINQSIVTDEAAQKARAAAQEEAPHDAATVVEPTADEAPQPTNDQETETTAETPEHEPQAEIAENPEEPQKEKSAAEGGSFFDQI